MQGGNAQATGGPSQCLFCVLFLPQCRYCVRCLHRDSKDIYQSIQDVIGSKSLQS